MAWGPTAALRGLQTGLTIRQKQEADADTRKFSKKFHRLEWTQLEVCRRLCYWVQRQAHHWTEPRGQVQPPKWGARCWRLWWKRAELGLNVWTGRLTHIYSNSPLYQWKWSQAKAPGAVARFLPSVSWSIQQVCRQGSSGALSRVGLTIPLFTVSR